MYQGYRMHAMQCLVLISLKFSLQDRTEEQVCVYKGAKGSKAARIRYMYGFSLQDRPIAALCVCGEGFFTQICALTCAEACSMCGGAQERKCHAQAKTRGSPRCGLIMRAHTLIHTCAHTGRQTTYLHVR